MTSDDLAKIMGELIAAQHLIQEVVDELPPLVAGGYDSVNDTCDLIDKALTIVKTYQPKEQGAQHG